MRQIFDIDAKLERIGDYAYIRISSDSVNQLVFAMRYSEDNWVIYSDSSFIDGSPQPRRTTYRERFPFISQYSGSWALPNHYTIRQGLEDCSCSNERFLPIDCEVIQESMPMPNDCSDEPTTTESAPISEFMVVSYESTAIYEGFHGYHHHRDVYMNKPKRAYRGHRIGIELEVEFNSGDERRDFCDKKSNWFYRESDGSLGSYGCEIISIPLMPQDAKSVDFWQTLTDYLSSHARSWDTGRCGLHVHIGREILGRTEEQQSETIGKLLYLYHHYVKDTRMNIKIYGRERGYNDTDGKTPVGDAAKIFGSEIFKIKSAAEKVKDAMIDKSSRDRYFDINLRNTATIEFRKGKGSINPKRIAMVVDYCERLCIYAKNTPWQQISYDDFVKFLKATVDNENLKEIINTWG